MQLYKCYAKTDDIMDKVNGLVVMVYNNRALGSTGGAYHSHSQPQPLLTTRECYQQHNTLLLLWVTPLVVSPTPPCSTVSYGGYHLCSTRSVVMVSHSQCGLVS